MGELFVIAHDWVSTPQKTMPISVTSPAGYFFNINIDINIRIVPYFSGCGAQMTSSFDMSLMGDALDESNKKKSASDFLGANANLVNLENLVSKPAGTGKYICHYSVLYSVWDKNLEKSFKMFFVHIQMKGALRYKWMKSI